MNLVVNHFLIGDLKRHVHKIHNGHKDYKCESCGRSFSQANYLKMHIHTVHEGDKVHKCDSCGKSFSQGSSLKTHIYTVHGPQRL